MGFVAIGETLGDCEWQRGVAHMQSDMAQTRLQTRMTILLSVAERQFAMDDAGSPRFVDPMCFRYAFEGIRESECGLLKNWAAPTGGIQRVPGTAWGGRKQMG